MRYVLAIATIATLALAVPASAEDAEIGAHVGPVGAGVTVGDGHHDRDRDHKTTVIKEHEPRDKTVIIKKDHEREPDHKVIIDKE